MIVARLRLPRQPVPFRSIGTFRIAPHAGEGRHGPSSLEAHRQVTRFELYCRHKADLAIAARMPGFQTVVEHRSPVRLVAIGNAWTRRLFDGPFYRSAPPARARPVVSLVFVQSREGNTVADDPSTLGGGATDKHLIYEGLSRVDADAVMAGATTAGERTVFSVWHPELVRLRLELGRSRHPAQVVVTDRGDLPFDRALMYAVPELRVFILARSMLVRLLRQRVRHRPWIEVIDAGDPLSLAHGLAELRDRGIEVVSAVGGRRTATALLRERCVSDLYLTTSPESGGEPNTPFYEGPPLPLTLVLEKAGRGPEARVRFQHFVGRT